MLQIYIVWGNIILKHRVLFLNNMCTEKYYLELEHKLTCEYSDFLFGVYNY